MPSARSACPAELAERIARPGDADYEDTGGVGGTLAGNALSLAAARATLERGADRRRLRAHDRAAPSASPTASRRRIARARAAVDVVAAGRRAEYRFAPQPPRNGARVARRPTTATLERYLHLYLLNRGVLITPFHNMALMCPATTEADVDRHTEVFAEAVAELAA